MKKKLIVILLLALGIALIFLSYVLTVRAASKLNIIGGVRGPIVEFIFWHGDGGIYCILAGLGVLSLASSIILAIVWKNKNNTKF